MEVIILPDPTDAARLVADEVLDRLQSKPNLVLGLATGSTPIEVYSLLVKAHQRNGIDFSRVRTFNLDEYIGLPADHPQSYRHFMQIHLFGGINARPENTLFPPVEGPNLRSRCALHEQRIRDVGGIDIQILGIGSNGHIGFNEPTSSLASRTRVKTLTDKTLNDNARFYGSGETQPRLASTLGIGTILDAKRIILQAFGLKKAEAIRACVEGPISSFWPGSALQLHSNVTIYLDEESSSLLSMRDYYLQTYENEKALRQEGFL